uniref:WD repeat-containing protein 91 n=1 Tax=Callorhinchus milii TaxID=7868 RepID=A0A4W3IFT7_CALMI
MAAAVERTDELVREYLFHRGFTSTSKAFEVERKVDKEKGFRVDRIVEQLQYLVQNYDLNGLQDYWNYLEHRLFRRLEDVYRHTVNKLKTSLYRYYLIHTAQTNRIDKTQEFFQKLALELQNQPEWKEWFILPFVPNPETNPGFATYFSKQWAETFLVSLHNFLSVLFQCMHILCVSEMQRTLQLQEENESLLQKLFAMQTEQKMKKPEEMIQHKLPNYVQNMDLKELTAAAKDGKLQPNAGADPGTVQQRKRRQQEHEKERKELLSKPAFQPSVAQFHSEPEIPGTPEVVSDQLDSPTKPVKSCLETGKAEQPFIVLSQEEYAEHHSSIMHCRVDCSGRRVASLDIDGVVKVWSLTPPMQTKATIMSKSPLLSLEWATKPDRLLLLGSAVGIVRLYDTEAKKSLYELTIDESCPRILSLACSPSGMSFVCCSAAPSIRTGTVLETGGKGLNLVPGKLLLWDTKTMKQQHLFCLDPDPIAINCTAFNHNGNLLVTGAADGIIRLFDMQRYDCAMSWHSHSGEVYSVEFSYDENSVYSIGEDGKFIQWNIHKSGEKVSECVVQADAIGPFVLSGYSGYRQVQVPRGRLFAFDSEGNYVLTCSSTGGIIHKLAGAEGSLESCLSLGGHRAPVVTVDWCTALDCGTCLTASMDGKIKLTTLLAQKPYS